MYPNHLYGDAALDSAPCGLPPEDNEALLNRLFLPYTHTTKPKPLKSMSLLNRCYAEAMALKKAVQRHDSGKAKLTTLHRNLGLSKKAENNIEQLARQLQKLPSVDRENEKAEECWQIVKALRQRFYTSSRRN